MSIPKDSLSNGSLNNLDKSSSLKKNGSLPNRPLNNFMDNPSTSKVINVLNNTTPTSSSQSVITIVDPGFQEPLLSQRKVVVSNPTVITEESQVSLLNKETVVSAKNEDERSQGIFKHIFCCLAP